MQITVFRPRTKEQLGPFSTETVRQMLDRGELSSDDFIHHEGLTEWTSISKLPASDLPRVPQPAYAANPLPRSNFPSTISTAPTQLTLEARITALETRISCSSLHSPKFWSRAFTVFGHYMAAVVAIYAVLFVIALVFIVIGTIIQHLAK
jgi:hypothetical protein